MAITVSQRKSAEKTRTAKAAPSAPSEAAAASPRPFFRKSVRAGEIIFFTSQLSLMMEIGTPLTLALKSIADQTANPTLRSVLTEVLRDVEEGRQLSAAMGRHPRVFNPVFTSLVRAGETGGFLKKILDSVVDMQEKQQVLIAQLKSTLTYPAVLCSIATLVVIFVLVSILPKFAVLFAGKEQFLPLSTRVLMAVSASLRAYWWAYSLAFSGLVTGLFFWVKSSMGRRFSDWFFVNAPLVKGITNKIHTFQLMRTLGHLMDNRVPLLEALEVTSTTFKNRHHRQFVNEVMEHVRQGGRFAQTFTESPYILESVKQMINTGEEVGNLPKVMLRLADYYDKEVNQELKMLAAMIEPIALVFIGIVVGLIVASVILPIFKMASVMH